MLSEIAGASLTPADGSCLPALLRLLARPDAFIRAARIGGGQLESARACASSFRREIAFGRVEQFFNPSAPAPGQSRHLELLGETGALSLIFFLL